MPSATCFPLNMHLHTNSQLLLPPPFRSCRVLEEAPQGAEAADALSECSTLVELLESRQAALAATLEGAFPELRATVWQSEASVQAAVQVRSQSGGVGWAGIHLRRTAMG